MSYRYRVTYYGRHNTKLGSIDVTASDYRDVLPQIQEIPESTVRLWIGMVPPPQPQPGICGVCGRRASKCFCLPTEVQHG
jgi:hypothetical protein